MFRSKLRPLKSLRMALFVEDMHLVAQITQARAAVPVAVAVHERGNELLQGRVVVVQSLEAHQRTQQGAGFARFQPGSEEEEDAVEIVLFRDDPVLPQVLGQYACRYAMFCIGARRPVEARRQQRELVRIGHGVAGREPREAMPVGTRL